MAGNSNLSSVQFEQQDIQPPDGPNHAGVSAGKGTSKATASLARKKPRRRAESSSQKRRCISTACIACRKRKSKCDGALPSCAACASVYGTDCIYDPNSDHRRKGVYREKTDGMAAQSTTLQILIDAIINAPENEVSAIVGKIRSSDNLDALAQSIVNQEVESDGITPDDVDENSADYLVVKGEEELARKMGELRFEDGCVRFIGGTSHLIYLGDSVNDATQLDPLNDQELPNADPITSWTQVTADPNLVAHLINMYFNYHYAYFTTLSKRLFFRDFMNGHASVSSRGSTAHCSSLLVNVMLALGCHFTDISGAYGTPGDSSTKGDHFFSEAKRLILENDEYSRPRLATVQALALMSVREAGCGREAKGWVYSGMSFRMAQDIGLNLEPSRHDIEHMTEEEIDARKITYWGCFVFDKCWSNYMGRLPQLPKTACNVSKYGIDLEEDSIVWSPLSDKGFDETSGRPSRARAAALQLVSLCEISSDLLVFFYHPNLIGGSRSKASELKKLGEIHQRLEQWRKTLPPEFEPTDGQLPNVILMHMFFHLQYIHLFRPFLKYSPSASPLPSHVSPRRICTANAGAISKLMRLYKKMYGLRQICNIAVYMIHSACTIHLLNLPEKDARRDIIHGVKEIEEIAEDWLCARRTLRILSVLARKWGCELPEEAANILKQADEKYGPYSISEVPSSAASPMAAAGVADDNSESWSRAEYGSSSQVPQIHVDVGLAPRSIGHNSSRGHHSQMTSETSYQLPNQGQEVPLSSMPLDFNANPAERWAGSPAGNPPIGYTSPIFPVSPITPVRADSRYDVYRRMQVGPSLESLSGQDWMLTDGAKWQHNFAGWGMENSVPHSEDFMFGRGQDDGFRQSSNNPPDDQGGASGFSGLATSLSTTGWLPGLD